MRSEGREKKKRFGTGFVEEKNFAKIWNLGLLKKHYFRGGFSNEREREREREKKNQWMLGLD
jgi:hypothetical protein